MRRESILLVIYAGLDRRRGGTRIGRGQKRWLPNLVKKMHQSRMRYEVKRWRELFGLAQSITVIVTWAGNNESYDQIFFFFKKKDVHCNENDCQFLSRQNQAGLWSRDLNVWLVRHSFGFDQGTACSTRMDIGTVIRGGHWTSLMEMPSEPSRPYKLYLEVKCQRWQYR